jgi:hypothetical protein
MDGIDEADNGERITWKRLMIWRKTKKIPDAVVLASRWMNESEKPGKGRDECHGSGTCWIVLEHGILCNGSGLFIEGKSIE